MKVADLGFPPSSRMTFNPKASMPVCPASEIGPPPINMSVSVDIVVARCPNAILGNGTATFGLAQSTNPILARAGEIVVFNGGRVGGLPKIKVYAYSYETLAGIYTEATLQPDGQLRFEIPPLTSDSSVTELNLSIPSKQITLSRRGPGKTVILPAGRKSDYVQAKCSDRIPVERGPHHRSPRHQRRSDRPGVQISDSGVVACTSSSGQAKIGRVQVNGPSKAKRNKVTTYQVKSRTAALLRPRASGSRSRARVSASTPRLDRSARARPAPSRSRPSSRRRARSRPPSR